jgi:hypothetical protein
MQENLNDYIYTPSSTDIALRWRKQHGYVPASEQEFYKKKWAAFRATFVRTLEDQAVIFAPPEIVVYPWRKRK